MRSFLVAVVPLVVAVAGGALYIGQVTAQLAGLQADVKDLQRNHFKIAIPGSPIIAFDSRECPAGWREFAAASGRTIVGTGKHSTFDRYGNELEEWGFGDARGSRTHRLEVPEIPEHWHTYIFSSGRSSPIHIDVTEAEFGLKDRPNTRTGVAGGGQPHNNMPPFIALSLCELISEDAQ